MCFTVTMPGVSFAFARLRLRAGSLWTGVFLLATHNTFIHEIFPGISDAGRAAAWFVDEFGALTAVAAILLAVFFWP